jgi:DNA replication protein DnaC
MRAPRLFEELALCHADGSFRKRLAAIAKISVLIIDDFAIAPIGPREHNDLLELLDDRVGSCACIVTSQLPVSDWHDYFGDPTLADAILDRLVHRSHRNPPRSQGVDAQARGGQGERQSQSAGRGLAQTVSHDSKQAAKS